MRCTCVVALVLAAPLSSRASEPPQSVVLADLGLHVIGVGAQRTLAPLLAAQVALESYTPWTQNIDLLGLSGTANVGDASGLLVRARLFVYPFASAPTGLWLSPFAQLGRGTATRAGHELTGTLWAVGASAGYAVIVGPSVHVALGLGAQFHVGAFEGGDAAPSFRRLYPTLDASVGYAF